MDRGLEYRAGQYLHCVQKNGWTLDFSGVFDGPSDGCIKDRRSSFRE